jgi:Mg-chelatase subunit ChlI
MFPETTTDLEAAFSEAADRWSDELGRIWIGKTDADAPTPEAETMEVEQPKTRLREYFRPNGERYLPRTIKIGESSFKDVHFIERAYQKKMPVLLYSDPGTGKTALIEAVFGGIETVQGTIETETADFVGSWVQQPDGTYSWLDGPLVRAAEAGKPLLIDEIALIDPRQLAVVYGAMDGRDEIVVTANPDRGSIKVNDGFLVFGATNPNVPGAVMSEALLSRFTLHVEFTTDWNIATRLDVPKRIVTICRNLETKKRSGSIIAAPQLREALAFRNIETEFGTEVALANFVGQMRPEDRPTVIDAIQAIYGVGALHNGALTF